MTHTELRDSLLERYPESQLLLKTGEDKAALLAAFPSLPDDYLQFLCEVGSGTIGKGRYAVYSEPLEPSEVFDQPTADGLREVVLIGDDFAGGHEAFSFGSPVAAFGSVDSTSGRFEPGPEDATFSSFIKRFFAD